jgi:hypothetical protein
MSRRSGQVSRTASTFISWSASSTKITRVPASTSACPTCAAVLHGYMPWDTKPMACAAMSTTSHRGRLSERMETTSPACSPASAIASPMARAAVK